MWPIPMDKVKKNRLRKGNDHYSRAVQENLTMIESWPTRACKPVEFKRRNKVARFSPSHGRELFGEKDHRRSRAQLLSIFKFIWEKKTGGEFIRVYKGFGQKVNGEGKYGFPL